MVRERLFDTPAMATLGIYMKRCRHIMTIASKIIINAIGRQNGMIVIAKSNECPRGYARNLTV